jgi:uncharacterized protein (TIGR00255 family)
MTGYATSDLQLPSTNIHLDIKSVNHRFFDLSFRAPDEFKSLESSIRDLIMQKIPRGKIDLRIYYKENQSSVSQIDLNSIKLDSYLGIYEKIKALKPELVDSNITDILKLPGVVDYDTIELDNIKDAVLATISKLADDLKTNQEVEGKKLSIIILSKIDKIDEVVKNCFTLLPTITQNYSDKLKQKLVAALDEAVVNEQRFQQEFAHFCQKIDVDEELSRLISHTKQFRSIVHQGGVVGKKIDFLTQEMLREANTLGSKSVSIQTTQYAVELKVLIEQIKEQLQNIS